MTLSNYYCHLLKKPCCWRFLLLQFCKVVRIAHAVITECGATVCSDQTRSFCLREGQCGILLRGLIDPLDHAVPYSVVLIPCVDIYISSISEL